ncbi:MAG: VCBS repeat-containing protein [Calditrichae bacterium]|nr:VCBS repeat-containing protein [Calditrichia bacterium]
MLVTIHYHHVVVKYLWQNTIRQSIILKENLVFVPSRIRAFPVLEWAILTTMVSKEFATGSASFPAHIYMWENTGNDTYEQVYQDTMSISNAYMTTTTNDIDNNGKTELFLGGSSFSGGVPISRIYWFEADGNNVYQKVRTFYSSEQRS